MYYTKDTILFLNGKFIKAVDAHSDLYSQTLHYGMGAFEGIRAYLTMNGVKIFKAYEHFERLKKKRMKDTSLRDGKDSQGCLGHNTETTLSADQERT